MSSLDKMFSEVAAAQDSAALDEPHLRRKILERRARQRRTARAATYLGLALSTLAVAYLLSPEESVIPEAEPIAVREGPAPANPRKRSAEVPTAKAQVEGKAAASPVPSEKEVASRPLRSAPLRSAPLPTAPLPTKRRSVGESASPDAAPSETWQALAAQGQHRRAFAIAEGIGFEELCVKSSLDELLSLNQVARFSGRPERSRLALETIRRRFSSDPQASVATFSLARLAADSFGDHGQAAKYFAAYLREQPNGALASIAAGRLIESHQKAGQRNAARRAARSYLKKHPQGAHAALARSLR